MHPHSLRWYACSCSQLAPHIKALELGRESMIRDPSGGLPARNQPPDLAPWRKEIQIHEEAILRLAALVDTRYFPPAIDYHNEISQCDKISRALAFMVSDSYHQPVNPSPSNLLAPTIAYHSCGLLYLCYRTLLSLLKLNPRRGSMCIGAM